MRHSFQIAPLRPMVLADCAPEPLSALGLIKLFAWMLPMFGEYAVVCFWQSVLQMFYTTRTRGATSLTSHLGECSSKFALANGGRKHDYFYSTSRVMVQSCPVYLVYHNQYLRLLQSALFCTSAHAQSIKAKQQDARVRDGSSIIWLSPAHGVGVTQPSLLGNALPTEIVGHFRPPHSAKPLAISPLPFSTRPAWAHFASHLSASLRELWHVGRCLGGVKRER